MILAAWTVFGLLHAIYWLATTYLDPNATAAGAPSEMPPSYPLGITATALRLAWTWAGLTPVIFRLTAAVAPSRIGWIGAVAAHVATFVAVAALVTQACPVPWEPS